MLGTIDAIANIAVKDVTHAASFYKEILGLHPLESSEPGVAMFQSGAAKILIYESEFAGTNQATTVSWVVGGDIENVVRELKSKGIVFEHYQMPYMDLQGDLHVNEQMKIAWFKDPDGNILSVLNG